MFDMGFTEMMLIGIVALVVIGPERLPGVARTAGKYYSRLRGFITSVRADVESELKADELREMFESQQKELQSLKEVIGDVGKDVGLSDISNEMSDIASSISDTQTISDSEPKLETKSAAKIKKTVKPATNSKPRAKSKTATKLKPRAKPKTKPGAGSKSKVDSASKAKAVGKSAPRAKSKVAKAAKVKAK